MRVKDVRRYLYNRVPLRILSYLSLNPDSSFSAKEIERSANASKGATHQVLQLFFNLDIIYRERKGNLFIYRINSSSPILRQFKIFEVITLLQPLVNDIKSYCYRIVLFGSCSKGDNTSKSDIDLFIKTEEEKAIKKHINKYVSYELNIKAAVFNSLELASSSKKDKIFLDEVKNGIILWEGKPDYEAI